ncbi:MAG: RHS repeat protein [Enterobacteriaceae bacterium]|jgi:insecticidal toxin complex protein TccC|nr:RHS repeat protein [Enterobacteriaceae bacterium]
MNIVHRNTPSVTVLNNRGQGVREIQYHRHPDSPETTDERITRHQYDPSGFLTQSIDPRLSALQQTNRAVKPNFTYRHSLSGAVLRTEGIDAGTSVTLNDIAGRTQLAVTGFNDDDRSSAVTHTWQYEDNSLPGRVLSLTEQTADGTSRITERFVWADNTQQVKDLNMAGQCVSHYETAGLVQTNSIALNGVPLSVTRRMLKAADEAETVADWQGKNASVWNDLLNGEEYVTLTTADATGAVLTTTDAAGNVQRIAYDVAGLLKNSWLTLKGGKEQPIVVSLTYSAAGQKLREEHGNGVVTIYSYESETQRLIRIKTERPGGHAAGAKVLQDLRYNYDPVGNVLSVRNDAEKTRFWRNQKVVPENTYTYDSLYQLVSATGREMANAGQQGITSPAPIVPLSTDNSAYTNYLRTYLYDTAGNLTQIRHNAPATNNNYTTDITVSDRSNRGVLSTLTENSAKVDTLFTAGGQQKQLQPGQNLSWTPRDELLMVAPVVREGAADDRESYRYDADSQRILKMSVQKTGNTVQSQRVLYLLGLELRNTTNGNTEKEKLQVVIAGSAGRAQVRLLHWEAGKPAEIPNDQVRYSYDNLTGSSGLELDGGGNVISMEEYYPYGGTAVWTARSEVEADYKTVRYSGKERDATGLYYYGYRYYQPWAGRWLSADPAGTVDGLNLFRMVRNNPVNYYDEQGTISRSIDNFISLYQGKNISLEGAHGNKINEGIRLFGRSGVPKVPQTRAPGSTKKPPESRPVLSSEHTILHTVTANGGGRGNNKKADGDLGKAIDYLERSGHAYQENDKAHRLHVGSNSGRFFRKTYKPDESLDVLTKAEYYGQQTVTNHYETYFDTQQTLLHAGDVSSAIQINQMAYFTDSDTLANLVRTNGYADKTNNSFYHSISVKDTYHYLNNDSEVVSVNVTNSNKIEMLLSRLMGVLGRAPSNKEFGDLLTELSIPFPKFAFLDLGNSELAGKSIFNAETDAVALPGPRQPQSRAARRRANKKARGTENQQ